MCPLGLQGWAGRQKTQDRGDIVSPLTRLGTVRKNRSVRENTLVSDNGVKKVDETGDLHTRVHVTSFPRATTGNSHLHRHSLTRGGWKRERGSPSRKGETTAYDRSRTINDKGTEARGRVIGRLMENKSRGWESYYSTYEKDKVQWRFSSTGRTRVNIDGVG